MDKGWHNIQRFTPYKHQQPLLGALVSGAFRNLIAVWNRRAGKDKSVLNACYQCMEQRVGNYIHVFPTGVEGRKNVWTNIDSDGFRTIDHIPESRIARRVENEMFIELVNGSTYQVIGANDEDKIRGSNPVGIIWSEYALMRPNVRLVVAPILSKNKGWEVYLYTPKGSNHAKKLYEDNKDNPDWFVELLTNDDTHTFTEEDVKKLRRDGMPEAWIQQEIYCSFVGPMVGAYYAREIEQAEREGRVCDVPWNPSLPVDTAWDIGIGASDATAVWFIQADGPWFNVLKYIETHGEGLPEWVQRLRAEPYLYGTHYAPHDMFNHQWSQGRQAGTTADIAKGFGVEYTRAPGPKRFGKGRYVQEGIEAARRLMPRMRFDAKGCEEGIDVLKNYRREIDERKQRDDSEPFLKDHPLHDWASHGADSLRYWAISTPHKPTEKPQPGDRDDEDIFAKLERKGGGGRPKGWQA